MTTISGGACRTTREVAATAVSRPLIKVTHRPSVKSHFEERGKEAPSYHYCPWKEAGVGRQKELSSFPNLALLLIKE